MNSNNMLQLEGAVENIVYRNEQNGYTVLEIADGEDLITAVGIMPQASVGDTVNLTGFFITHKTYGKQFSVSVCEICRPTESADILKYLSSGAIKGIGAVTAQRLVSEFGESTLDVMENQPDRVARLRGITESKALAFSAQLKANTGVRTLMLFLGEYGISNTSSVKIYNAFGAGCVEKIKENPYILCSGEFGVTFENADFIAKRENLEAESNVRLRAGITYVLKHNEQNGHTCLPKNKLIEISSRLLQVNPELVAGCMDEMIFDRSVIGDKIGDEDFVFTTQLHLIETYIASRVKMMLEFDAEKIDDIEQEIKICEKNDGIEYAELQKQAVTSALTEGMLILTGGPGTGKTTTLNAIINILKRKGKKVLLSAPTGRAAQRMSEVTGDEAKTLHRMLEVSWDKQDNPVFNKNERNQLKCDALIIDEVSMVDSYIFESVMRALPLGCRLILVGDSDQLPSVGPGNVLGDLIESGVVPVIRLNEIFRQAQKSLIVTNAHKIVNGVMPDLKKVDKDFFFIYKSDKTSGAETILDLCSERLPKAYGYSPLENIQVLSPSKKGELGTAELNRKLQARLNPKSDDKAEVTIGSRTFRTGDKVMQIKNNYDISWYKDNGETGEGIFNGDIGIIQNIDKKSKSIKINFYDKTAVLTYDYASELDFAYAITVHKSQGNEFDAVVIPMFSGPPQLYYRNLLYTAVTRAKKTLILVGVPQTVEYMVNNNRRTKRYSGLKEFLQRADTIY
ncbi:ATP-dependent RecD-like DNA helicase [Ruminococcus sp. YE282]|jgi:exodeoxyribonuclease V alpha subunit|uniref:SF1B family DNA helicase RecD2 n=1 Tax=Ruminococcus sp. YE282 TaxID=3158780 RepID=UPI0008852120|nr:ATP-dependent RecD-like DNA helicase [Ruminococcus bromii]MEE3498657.1 ATP-dependent RecD-like DNA helicase [Ruminococcus bromii]SCY67288.1 exodeoxyribonuclease V alpha subunit [Ruminococcus bromii]